jgi:cobalt-zinc-cadmium efflux system membrane fusion protein
MKRLLFLRAAIVLSIACQKKPADKPPPDAGASIPVEHRDEAEHEQIARQIKLTPEVVREADVRTEPARRQRLSDTVDLNGQLVPDPETSATIGARVSGRISAVLIHEGDRVRAGQTLALVTSPEVSRLRGERASTTFRAVAARRNAARLRELFQARLGAEQEAVAAEAEAAALEAQGRSLSRTLRGLGAAGAADSDASTIPLVSPIAGTLVHLAATSGQMIEPSNTVAVVADLSRVWFQAQLFEKDLAQVEEGAPAEVRLNGYPDRVFKATVARLSGMVDPQSRTLTARLSLQDPERKLRLGLFGKARVSVRSDGAEDVLCVPLAAVTDLGDRKAVFVRQPDGDFDVHEVRLGRTAGGLVAILSGLNPGEQVVVSGVHTLKSIALKSTMGEAE